MNKLTGVFSVLPGVDILLPQTLQEVHMGPYLDAGDASSEGGNTLLRLLFVEL